MTRLPIIPSLPVLHRSQEQLSDCLAACAAMVIAFSGKSIPYDHLLKTLSITPSGAPRRNILRLTSLGVSVTYREATLPIIAEYLQAGHPVIAFVDSGELSYWTTATNHALVIVGMDNDHVYVLDPAFPPTPIAIAEGEFHLAWLNCDYMCAIVE